MVVVVFVVAAVFVVVVVVVVMVDEASLAVVEKDRVWQEWLLEEIFRVW